MSFNKDEMEPPIWMDGDFFKDVLNVCKKGFFLNIVNYEITPATVVGDHFASIMFRAKVTYLDNENVKQEITLIVKTMAEDGIKKEMLQDSKIFETEIRMYRDIIPKMEKILRQVGDNTVLGAKMLYWSLSPRKIVIFEDITKRGFQTIGMRMASLDETKLALDKLAIWHAVSYYYNIKSNGELETFKDGVFNIPGIENNDFFCSGITEAIKLVKTIEGFEEYVPKLEKISKTLIRRCNNAYKKCQGGILNILNHGDFHSKNMMFKYNENGKVEDVMLIDFQISVWGSMAIDLIYASYMLTDMKTRIDHMDEMRYNFFNKFIETLKKIGYDGKLPEYTDLQIEFINMNYIELFIIVTFLPFIHAVTNKSDAFDLDPTELFNNENQRSIIYHQNNYVNELKILLPQLLYKGYLDGYDED